MFAWHPDGMTRRDRFRGALVGLAVGDAVGTTVEFKPPGTFEPVTAMAGGGPFDLPAGAWTDDTSMALCLAESLVETRTFDPVDQLRRYVRWYREGHWSSTGRCFDIGNATRAALHRFEQTGEPFPGDAAPAAAGNGPLMKLAPVVLAYASRPAEAIRFAGESARTTHGAPEAVDASRAFASLLLGALHEIEPPDPGMIGERVATALASRRVPPDVRGGGYVIDALEAALWALRATTSFEEGVLAAVNLGDDADTTAAIYGQLAGALHGLDGIPRKWRDMVHAYDDLLAFADALYDLDVARPAIARFEHVKPARIVECATPEDVAGALALDGPFAVRSGGHDFAGRSSTTGVLIDTRPMRAIQVDEHTVTVGAGARLGEIYDALEPHGRTIAGGCGPTVGIAGLALGGGIGILGRLHGFTCDQIVGAQVVLADGTITAADGDLLWALNGAGGARFGVFTRFTLTPVPAPASTAVHLALDDARQALETWQHLDAPDELAVSLLILKGTAHVFGAHIGGRAHAAALLAPFGGEPTLTELPYRALKRHLAETGPGDGEDLPFHRSGFFGEPVDLHDLDPDLEYDFSPLGGAYNRVAPDATAFAHRDARFLLKVAGADQQGVDGAFPPGATGVYVNFPEPDRDPWDAAYLGSNRERLLELRDVYGFAPRAATTTGSGRV
jgi:ADP-ribosyl-[dinitrogen reductase] hydrolase